ncbi:helix-turn-helix domain-containing protein [Sporolactobacillus putidus]|uniref:Transcriptional regulator n=1 Tax=Sporolactobacillus putidus TaxID=492735 RepID=A0A917S550_9BACL|nr:helix-turn-helix domain-containing protein [Sporolactobacillus putidus]GGL55206.1 transcriptional regulator [Sporolactobacillus putidus]
MDHLQHCIARNLQAVRNQKGLSLDGAASLTGVSKSMLSQIEKGKSSPTVSTLWKIASGLQVSFSSLMKEEAAEIKKIDSRNLSPALDDRKKYSVYSLFPYHPEKKYEIYLVKLKPHAAHTSEGHTGEEYMLISTGSVALTINEQTSVLHAGDALLFTAGSAHTYRNESDQEASFFDLIYYPE